MKKYTNMTDKMRTIEYVDGSAQFLMRGQSIKTDKEVKSLQEGIKESVVTTVKASKLKTSTRKKSNSTSDENKED